LIIIFLKLIQYNLFSFQEKDNIGKYVSDNEEVNIVISYFVNGSKVMKFPLQ